MISNKNKTTDLAAEEIESIGTEFAARYYDALVGKPNSSALRHFYNDLSRYVYVQPERPDCVMEGLLLIGRFMKRMDYGRCTITIRSVTITRRVNPAEFMVSSVCDMSRPGNTVPRTFTQSFVIKRVPWTTADFQIVETEFKFNDNTVDFSIPIALGDKPKGPCAISTGTSRKLVNPTMNSGRKSARKSKVVGTPVDRNGTLNNPGKKPMTTSTPAGAGVVNGNVRGLSSPRRAGNQLAIVLKKKGTEKPTITMTMPVPMNALKDETKKPKAPTTVNKTFGDEAHEDLNKVKWTTSVRPTLGGSTTFASFNRYGCLTVMDQDCPLDVQDDILNHHPIHLLAPTVSEQDAPNEANGRSKKPRRNRKRNGCKRNNGGGVVAPKGFNEVEVAEPKYSCLRRLGQGWTLVREFVRPIFFNLTFNHLKW